MISPGLGAAADGFSDDDLAPWVDHGDLATSYGITLISHMGLSRAQKEFPTWSSLVGGPSPVVIGFSSPVRRGIAA
jgi:hypothetical protein